MAEKIVSTSDYRDHVFVSDYGDGEIWLNVQCGRGSAAVVMSAKQAQELVAALQAQIVQSTEVAA